MKDAQQLAEERYPDQKYIVDQFNVDIQRFAFIAGHGSRDAEIGKLVEAAKELMDYMGYGNDDIFIQPMKDRLNKLREALKPYQKEEGK